MPRPPVVPPEEKARLVLSILGGEVTVAEAARRAPGSTLLKHRGPTRLSGERGFGCGVVRGVPAR